MASDFYKLLTDFLSEYLEIPESYKGDDGTLKDESIIKHCIWFLVNGGVFEKEEMRKEALRNYHIILPHHYFEECE